MPTCPQCGSWRIGRRLNAVVPCSQTGYREDDSYWQCFECSEIATEAEMDAHMERQAAA